MYQSRDEVRQIFLDVWQKIQHQALLEPMEAIIAGVLEQHPEYHSLIESGDEVKQREFTPEQGQANPFLHMGMHITLREQASADQPTGFRQQYDRLVASRGQHEAEHAMMDCLGAILWRAQREQMPPDEAEYLDCLKKL